VLAFHRHVADLIRRAGIEHRDAALAEEALRGLLPVHCFFRDAGHMRVLRVDAVNELAGVDLHLRRLDDFIAVEIELREHGIHALFGVGLERR
jgi:hypothetical protein